METQSVRGLTSGGDNRNLVWTEGALWGVLSDDVLMMHDVDQSVPSHEHDVAYQHQLHTVDYCNTVVLIK